MTVASFELGKDDATIKSRKEHISMLERILIIVAFVSVSCNQNLFAQKAEDSFFESVHNRLVETEASEKKSFDVSAVSADLTAGLFGLASRMLPETGNSSVNVMAAAKTLSLIESGAQGQTKESLQNVFSADDFYGLFFRAFKSRKEISIGVCPYNFTEEFQSKAKCFGFELKNQELTKRFVDSLNEEIEERTSIASAITFNSQLEAIFTVVSVEDVRWTFRFEAVVQKSFRNIDGTRSSVNFVAGEVKGAKHLCNPADGWLIEMNGGYNLFIFETTSVKSILKDLQKGLVKFEGVEDVVLEIPKVRISSEFDFESIPELENIFSNSSDFGIMMENRNPKISVANQKNRLAIDEAGILSASVTSVTMVSKGLFRPKELMGKRVTFNKPFVGVITKTANIDGKVDQQPIIVFTVDHVD